MESDSVVRVPAAIAKTMAHRLRRHLGRDKIYAHDALETTARILGFADWHHLVHYKPLSEDARGTVVRTFVYSILRDCLENGVSLCQGLVIISESAAQLHDNDTEHFSNDMLSAMMGEAHTLAERLHSSGVPLLEAMLIQTGLRGGDPSRGFDMAIQITQR